MREKRAGESDKENCFSWGGAFCKSLWNIWSDQMMASNENRTHHHLTPMFSFLWLGYHSRMSEQTESFKNTFGIEARTFRIRSKSLDAIPFFFISFCLTKNQAALQEKRETDTRLQRCQILFRLHLVTTFTVSRESSRTRSQLQLFDRTAIVALHIKRGSCVCRRHCGDCLKM